MTVVLPISFSPQVKRCAFVTYKHSIYEFPHELPNDLRLRPLGNSKYQESLKTSLNDSLLPNLPV